MKIRKPNKIVAPLVIAGITIGFLTAAYRFIFSGHSEIQDKQPAEPNLQTGPSGSEEENQEKS